jgi:hypothetical protein
MLQYFFYTFLHLFTQLNTPLEKVKLLHLPLQGACQIVMRIVYLSFLFVFEWSWEAPKHIWNPICLTTNILNSRFREYRIITMPISSHLLTKKFPLTSLFIIVPDQIIVAAKVSKAAFTSPSQPKIFPFTHITSNLSTYAWSIKRR